MQHRTNDTESLVSTRKAVTKAVAKPVRKARRAKVGKDAWGDTKDRSILAHVMVAGKQRKKRERIERHQDIF